MIAERLAAARTELRFKSKTQIEVETASTWAARAIAAHEQYLATRDLRWYAQAVSYAGEACEHASGGPAGTLETIQAEMAALGFRCP